MRFALLLPVTLAALRYNSREFRTDELGGKSLPALQRQSEVFGTEFPSRISLFFVAYHLAEKVTHQFGDCTFAWNHFLIT